MSEAPLACHTDDCPYPVEWLIGDVPACGNDECVAQAVWTPDLLRHGVTDLRIVRVEVR